MSRYTIIVVQISLKKFAPKNFSAAVLSVPREIASQSEPTSLNQSCDRFPTSLAAFQ